jgi:hypothetical protein
MKKLIAIVVSIIVLFSLSCRHDKCCVPPEPSSKMTAEKNGAYWNTFDVIGKLSATNFLTIYAISGDVIPTGFAKADSLNFSITYTNQGSYNLHSDQVFYGVFNKGVTTSYKLDTTYNNVLNITGYQTLHNPATTNPDPIKITGTFNIKLVDPKNPAGISFLNGDFYTIITR